MSAGFGSRMSLGVRLSLLFAACTAAVSLIAGLIFSRAIDEHFVELDHMAMSAKLAVFRDELRGLGSEQQMRRREAELLRELARHPDLGLRLNGPDGNLWFERLPQPAHPGLPANRELGAPLEPGNDASPRLTVILDISHHQHFLQRMRQLIWLTMSLSALATALLGAWATGASLAPLRRMREVAARVSANSLTTRLDASRMPEELRGLAGELNAMLARLEEAFQRLSAFSADIAHELRTPLTSLLTQTQVVLSRPRSLEDYREALHGNLEELERLTAMVNDMLLLAKADHGLLAPSRQALDLGAEVDSRMAGASQCSRDRCSQCCPVCGPARLANLLDNALRHTADGGEIRIRLGDRRLSVENQGPAIPPERLPRLFDRFYRADPARREGQGEHAGLGLAICRSIVQAHGGEIRCESADGWTRFVIDFARPRR
ncbi:heavy metal sensor histidine kinase [Pseudomonas aeruginosa]|uniref:heavy metal sensor histidine kinase n=1 Tax=Pseudomonas aeruginosa TaxID=287 RepID=UPI00071B8260|nr:heavy metal sensor histidine kinase [Pseudomonas aeruginosa]KSF34144.1 sensor histidine kinase [Pseudomonas aeruginosa]